MTQSLHSIKSQFPIFTHRPELVYLDNAATTQKPQPVIQVITDFYEKENATVHRGLYELSGTATRRYEEVRKKVCDLIGAANPRAIAFTKGTTESINIVAQSFLRKNLKRGDHVVISVMEHHANLIPWQQVCVQTGAALSVIPMNDDGELIMEKFESLLDQKTRFVALTHISNVTGTVNPIEEFISRAHKRNIPVLIDAAQSAGHHVIDVKKSNVDFLAFSAHKMFGPMGTGVLYCSDEYANQIDPFNFGGGGIRDVEFGRTEFLDYPNCLEAGTANIPGVIGLGTAIDFVQRFDMNEMMIHTFDLNERFKEKLSGLGHVKIIGNAKNTGSIVSFSVENIHPHDVAGFLAKENIAVRAGHHCAQPLLESMGVPATVRVSFSIYNTMEDVDKIIDALVGLKKFWS